MNLHTLTCGIPYWWVPVAEHGRYEAVDAWRRRKKAHQRRSFCSSTRSESATSTRQPSLVALGCPITSIKKHVKWTQNSSMSNPANLGSSFHHQVLILVFPSKQNHQRRQRPTGAVPTELRNSKTTTNFSGGLLRSRQHCVAYSPVIACHHRGDVLLNVRTLTWYGIERKIINIVLGTQGIELPVRPLHMRGDREIVRTTSVQSPFQKKSKLLRTKKKERLEHREQK